MVSVIYKCPVCGAKTEVVRNFEDGKTLAVRCNAPHYRGMKRTWDKTTEIYKNGEVFVIELEGEKEYTWPLMLKEYVLGEEK